MGGSVCRRGWVGGPLFTARRACGAIETQKRQIQYNIVPAPLGIEPNMNKVSKRMGDESRIDWNFVGAALEPSNKSLCGE